MPQPSQPRLLSRDVFRETVLARHGGRCCVPGCTEAALDAHHILNRNLFTSPAQAGGYFEANGANLCGSHHLAAERTDLSVEDLRTWCAITEPVIPEHLSGGAEEGTVLDTWGNVVLADGTRMPGELFYGEACQKVLAPLLHLFSTRAKPPRTFHLPWSPGRSSDDKVLSNLNALAECPDVVMSLKMDGESNTFYPDGYSHARSTTASPHPSRDHVRALAAMTGPMLPQGWRVVGENLWARHSVAYEDLPALFQVFAIWDRDTCLSWDETVEWCALLDLETVPVIYRGPWPGQRGLTEAFAPYAQAHEGYVVRDAGAFPRARFSSRVAKMVRADHVTTEEHWMHGPVVRNGTA